MDDRPYVSSCPFSTAQHIKSYVEVCLPSVKNVFAAIKSFNASFGKCTSLENESSLIDVQIKTRYALHTIFPILPNKMS